MKARWNIVIALVALGLIGLPTVSFAKSHGGGQSAKKKAKKEKKAQAQNLAGTTMMWEDRGPMTPTRVFFGEASVLPDPNSRAPKPPFSHFVKDTTPNAYSPKCYCTDANGIKWTVKFGSEVHPDVAAARLAWALGYGVDESYYVGQGHIDGVTSGTDLGKARGHVKSDGTFTNARLKRHNKEQPHLVSPSGDDMVWDEGKNPGVPSEQLSGLILLDDLVYNWDAQPKNCKVMHLDTPKGPQNWYIMSDWGESFGNRKSAWKLSDYQHDAFVKGVSGGFVELSFQDAISPQTRVHSRVPLADAQWFRARLLTLTDDDLRAAFDASVANDAMVAAYASGDPAKIRAATSPDVTGFVQVTRARINEFLAKVPPAP